MVMTIEVAAMRMNMKIVLVMSATTKHQHRLRHLTPVVDTACMRYMACTTRHARHDTASMTRHARHGMHARHGTQHHTACTTPHTCTTRHDIYESGEVESLYLCSSSPSSSPLLKNPQTRVSKRGLEIGRGERLSANQMAGIPIATIQ